MQAPDRAPPRPGTQHDRILIDIKEKILGGIWPLGHRIPFETDLARQYGVSRMTVNKVLTQLTTAGFLNRKRKLGTMVCLPRVQSAIMQITAIEHEITRLGRSYSYRLLSRNVRLASTADQAQLAVTPENRVLALASVHSADGVPFCSEDRLINLAAVPAAESVDFQTEAAGGWLLGQVPWSSAEHAISAINAGAGLASVLHIKPGTACLQVNRLTKFGGVCVTQASLIYPGEQHQMVAQFSPQSA